MEDGRKDFRARGVFTVGIPYREKKVVTLTKKTQWYTTDYH